MKCKCGGTYMTYPGRHAVPYIKDLRKTNPGLSLKKAFDIVKALGLGTGHSYRCPDCKHIFFKEKRHTDAVYKIYEALLK